MFKFASIDFLKLKGGNRLEKYFIVNPDSKISQKIHAQRNKFLVFTTQCRICNPNQLGG